MTEKSDPLPGEIVLVEEPALTFGQTQGLAHPGKAAPVSDTVVEAEWVQRFAPRRRINWLRYFAALLKLVAGVALAWLFYVIPPAVFPNPFQNWKNPIVIAILVCYIGKTLLDTFFYDHFQP